jgi:hypothetical protein
VFWATRHGSISGLVSTERGPDLFSAPQPQGQGQFLLQIVAIPWAKPRQQHAFYRTVAIQSRRSNACWQTANCLYPKDRIDYRHGARVIERSYEGDA